MNKKELGEIKRRIKLDRSSITHIYGCYVNGAREIISYIDESLGLLTKEETEQYLALLKKSLSGTLGKNLLDISFATKQVMDSDEHRLLSALRRTRLEDAEIRERFYRCVIDSLNMDDNYLILIAHDAYDVPYRGKDGALQEDSSEVFNYILCSICPVKTGKAALGFDPDEKRFTNHSVGQFAGKPELGFMFPAFDDRSANIYNALFYSRNTGEIHKEFIDAVFRTEVPMSAGHQREAFHTALSEGLSGECSYEVISNIHTQISERLEMHRESRDPEQPYMSTNDLSELLRTGGIDDEHVEKFREACDREFGENAFVNPSNIVNEKKLEILTPQVKITVDPKSSHLVRTCVIDGKKYIMISAEAGAEVNGVAVNIED